MTINTSIGKITATPQTLNLISLALCAAYKGDENHKDFYNMFKDSGDTIYYSLSEAGHYDE